MRANVSFHRMQKLHNQYQIRGLLVNKTLLYGLVNTIVSALHLKEKLFLALKFLKSVEGSELHITK